MALIVKDRVRETTASTGTSDFVLDGAADGYQSFNSGIGDNNTTYYAAVLGLQFEVGIGTYNHSTLTLTRDTILESSNSNNKVVFASGDKNVFCTYPAEKSVIRDENDKVTIPLSAKFTPIPHPVHEEGVIFYDNVHNTFNYQNDISSINFEIGENEYIRVYNDTLSTIEKGKPVTFAGVVGSIPKVVLCNATNVSTYQVDGLVTEDIAAGSEGYITISGIIRDIDTSSLTAGQRTFVGLTDGALTNTAPTYPNYPMCVGYTVTSDATTGEIVVIPQNHSVPNFRIINNAHIGNDVIIEGNLTVQGSQTIASSANIETGAPFIYLASGDTIGEANTTFTGTGNDDAYYTGHFTGTASTNYYVKIDGTGATDTFAWSKDNFATTEASGVAITGAEQALDNGIKILFATTTGHTLNDQWSGTAAPADVDTGLWTNRNTGASGVGYTHLGIFFDVTDSKWKLVDEYDPEPEGTINVSDPSYSTGTLVANVEGNLTGNADTVTDGVVTTGSYSDPTWITGLAGSKISGNISGNAANITAYTVNQNVGSSDSPTFSTLNATTVDLGNWTITESSGVLYFATGGVNKMKLDSSGNLTTVGNVTAYGTV